MKRSEPPLGGHWVSIYCQNRCRGNPRPELWNPTQNRCQYGKIKDNTEQYRQYKVVVVTLDLILNRSPLWLSKILNCKVCFWVLCYCCKYYPQKSAKRNVWKVVTLDLCSQTLLGPFFAQEECPRYMFTLLENEPLCQGKFWDLQKLSSKVQMYKYTNVKWKYMREEKNSECG